MIIKQCSCCHIEKLLNCFWRRKAANGRSVGYGSWCKECCSIRRRTIYAERKHDQDFKELVKQKEEKRRQRDKVRRPWLRKYGLTTEEVIKMEKDQENCCLICLKPFDSIKKWGGSYVDHCHNTNTIRGLLCRDCNLMIGLADHDISIIEGAIIYLS